MKCPDSENWLHEHCRHLFDAARPRCCKCGVPLQQIEKLRALRVALQQVQEAIDAFTACRG